MTNPGNAVGTNAAYGGRTSVNAFNDILASLDGPGILTGWKCNPQAGLTVALGGDNISRDVAVAEDDIGNRTTVNNRSKQPIEITLAEAPALGQRIDLIVAYVNNPPESEGEEVDSPETCGLISVTGEVAANNPVVPTESEIRTAIGLDGGISTTAYYVVLAQISVTEGMTDVIDGNITSGKKVGGGTVDAALNPLSTNPVQNKVITEQILKINQEIEGVGEALTNLDTGEGV